MAITSRFYPSATRSMFNGVMNAGSSYKIALLSSSGSFNGAHTAFSSLTAHQVSGTGYTAGGLAISVGPATSNSLKTEIPVGTVTWSNASFTFRHAVIYETAGGNLLMHLDFGYDQVLESQDLTINVPSPSPSATPV